MRFQIKTLVDVTQTHARKGDHPEEVKQQANFMTLYNTIGLRTNPEDFVITSEVQDIKDLEFGSEHKGKLRVWTIDFTVEQDQSLTLDMMLNDFELVPFISGLTENAKFKSSIFRTNDSKYCNIIFNKLDK